MLSSVVYRFVFAVVLLVALIAAITVVGDWAGNRATDLESIAPGVFLSLCAILLMCLVPVFRWSVARTAATQKFPPKLLGTAATVAGGRRLEEQMRRAATKLEHRGKRAEAIDVRSRVIDLDPLQPVYWVDRGMAHYFISEFDKAISDLSRALEIDPEARHAHLYRGCAYVHKLMAKPALDDLNRHDCVEKSDAEIAVWRGQMYEQLFQWKSAAREYLLAMQLDDLFVGALILLSRLRACCPDEELRDGKLALSLARRADELTDHKDWQSISTLAAAHAELGEFEEAVSFARKAADLAPDDEKATRRKRIELYERGDPFRLPHTDEQSTS